MDLIIKQIMASQDRSQNLITDEDYFKQNYESGHDKAEHSRFWYSILSIM